MLCRLVEQMSVGGHELSVVSLLGGGPLRRRLAAAGAGIDELDLRRGRIPSAAGVARLAKAVRHRRPELLQGWMYEGNLAALFGAWSLGLRRPVVWNVTQTCQDLGNEKPFSRLRIRLGAVLSRFASAIVYCSRVSARQHEQLGYVDEKTTIIPNGVDPGAFRPDPQAKARLCGTLGINPAAVVLGMVARAHPMKDHGNFIAAATNLLNTGQNIHIVLVGTGADAHNERLARQIHRAGIGERAVLLGERTDIPAIIPGFDILALSSSSEAFPLVLAEAMASSVPCIATDVGDCAWIIGDTGVVVPPRDPDALTAGLERVIALGPVGRRRLGAAARARVIENFTLAQVARQYEALYRRLARRT